MLKRSANELAQQCEDGDGEEYEPLKGGSTGAAGAAGAPGVRTCHSSGLEMNIVRSGGGASRRTKSKSIRRPGTAPAKVRRCGGVGRQAGGRSKAAEVGKQRSFVSTMSTDDECCVHQYSCRGINQPTDSTGKSSPQRIRAQTAARSRSHSYSIKGNCRGCSSSGVAKKHARRGTQSADRSRARSSGAFRCRGCSHPLTVTFPLHPRVSTGSDADLKKTNATAVETTNNIDGESQSNPEVEERMGDAVSGIDQHRRQTKGEDEGIEGNGSDNAAARNIASCRLQQRGDEEEKELLAMRRGRPPTSADNPKRRSRGGDVVDSDGQQEKQDGTTAAPVGDTVTVTVTAEGGPARDVSVRRGSEVAGKEIRSPAGMDDEAVQV